MRNGGGSAVFTSKESGRVALIAVIVSPEVIRRKQLTATRVAFHVFRNATHAVTRVTRIQWSTLMVISTAPIARNCALSVGTVSGTTVGVSMENVTAGFAWPIARIVARLTACLMARSATVPIWYKSKAITIPRRRFG